MDAQVFGDRAVASLRAEFEHAQVDAVAFVPDDMIASEHTVLIVTITMLWPGVRHQTLHQIHAAVHTCLWFEFEPDIRAGTLPHLPKVSLVLEPRP